VSHVAMYGGVQRMPPIGPAVQFSLIFLFPAAAGPATGASTPAAAVGGCGENAAMTIAELAAFEHLDIAANGLRFHALAAGPMDGPLLLLLHGFPESSHGWHRQVGPLAAAGFRVVAPDQRGVGLSSKPTGVASYRIDLLAADSVAIIRALGRERAQVVGHADMVERVAILDAPHPDAFSAYVRRHPSQLARSWYMAFFQLPRLPEAMLRANDFRRLAHTLVDTSRPGAFTAEDLAVYRTTWGQPGALTGMLNWYRALRLGARTAGDSRVTIPVRLMWGDQDHALEPGLADASIIYCDVGEVFHFPDATHWLQHEEPERVVALLLEFLRR